MLSATEPSFVAANQTGTEVSLSTCRLTQPLPAALVTEGCHLQAGYTLPLV